MLASQAFFDLVSLDPRSVVNNYKQVYRERNDYCISITLFCKSKFKM